MPTSDTDIIHLRLETRGDTLTSCVVIPPEDTRKDVPSLAASLVLGIAAVQMPDVALDLVGSRSVSLSFASLASEKVIESVPLKVTDCLAEQSSPDEQQEISHDDEEDRQG